MTKSKVNMNEKDFPPISPLIPPAELAWPLDPKLISGLLNQALANRHSAAMTLLHRQNSMCPIKPSTIAVSPDKLTLTHFPVFLERFTVCKKMCVEASSH